MARYTHRIRCFMECYIDVVVRSDNKETKHSDLELAGRVAIEKLKYGRLKGLKCVGAEEWDAANGSNW